MKHQVQGKKREAFASFICALLLLSGPMALSSATIVSFTVTPGTHTMQDLDPDSYAEVTSPTDLVVSFQITGLRRNQSWTLSIMAPGDLISGSNSIPIANARWEVTGNTISPPGTFQNGTLSLGVYLQVGTGPGNNTDQVASGTCDIRIYLKNYWTYLTGSYNRQITLRLEAPPNRTSYAYFNLAAAIAQRLKLTFGMTGINFPDSSPDAVLSIPAGENPVSVTAAMRTAAAQASRLQCLAAGDLVSGADTIPINNVTWTSSGTGYVPGTMNRTAAQACGNWSGSGNRPGTFSYFLANSWDYNSGAFANTVLYTLLAL